MGGVREALRIHRVDQDQTMSAVTEATIPATGWLQAREESDGGFLWFRDCSECCSGPLGLPT